MNSVSLKRKESEALGLVSNILNYNITNVNVIDPVVMDVSLSNDLSHLKVYVSLYQNEAKGIEALNNAAGYVRSVFAKSVNWRKVPQIHFYLDEVSKNGLKIDKILHDINSETK
ncbi:30S ribosome-binding factor RbfA [Mycoplasma nasistruthionis]|uniref:Ribosome-binding factor A n=1 Tax=Mycoplasma nasistruthionis TaxID=353852 RepID=A0A4Y6I5X5_9MOLU|nr:30S ribosome-binding factor RbfA [Mycoplasma nasistruthionis]QCZ36628.1 30S ribosome-binding factor RbfA [Mycoplasma nasistruthionis]QDF64923.1 30S ribosome-binding factor RbfA [Mycoplasma nasistruthionis]